MFYIIVMSQWCPDIQMVNQRPDSPDSPDKRALLLKIDSCMHLNTCWDVLMVYCLELDKIQTFKCNLWSEFNVTSYYLWSSS